MKYLILITLILSSCITGEENSKIFSPVIDKTHKVFSYEITDEAIKDINRYDNGIIHTLTITVICEGKVLYRDSVSNFYLRKRWFQIDKNDITGPLLILFNKTNSFNTTELKNWGSYTFTHDPEQLITPGLEVNNKFIILE